MSAIPSCFDALPLKERWFVRARQASAPIVEVAEAAVGESIVEIGCGHGLVLAHVAQRLPQARVLGVDVDDAKIRWAQAGAGRLPNVELRVEALEALAARQPGAFDCALVCDVLYLLPVETWRNFLAHTRTLLRRGGRLVLKEAEDDGSWKVTKALLQERFMVSVLGKTQGSGGLQFAPRDVLTQALSSSGFRVASARSFSGYSTPHVLLVADCV